MTRNITGNNIWQVYRGGKRERERERIREIMGRQVATSDNLISSLVDPRTEK